MRKLQNATVRNAAGFRGVNGPVEQKTLFSNSFIRDSVISTLKHNSKDGDGPAARAGIDRYSDVSSEMQTLNQPRLSSQESIDNRPQVHNPYIGAKRPSILSHTSYFNQAIMDKPDEQHNGNLKEDPAMRKSKMRGVSVSKRTSPAL